MKNFFQFSLGLIAMLTISMQTMAENTRLITIDGALTEIVFLLGAGDKVVAVDTTSTQPAAVKQLPNVGYLRALSAEGVLSLQPTQIITTSSAGPKPTLVQLEKSGVTIDVVDQPYSIEGLRQKVLEVAQLINKTEEGKALVADINAQLKPLQARIAANADKPKLKALFFLGMQGNQLMAAGKGTQADALLSIAGIENAGASFHAYKPLSTESVLQINPDIIVIAQHTQTDESAKAVFNYTSAFKNNKILVENSANLLGFGPRLPSSLKMMVDLAHP